MTIRFSIILLFLFAATPTFSEEIKHGDHSHQKKNGIYYTCPMHPDVIQDKPGACPVCHMDLVKVDNTKNENNQENAKSEIDERAVIALKIDEDKLLNLKFKKIKNEVLTTELKASGRALSSDRVFLQVPESDAGYLDIGAKVSIESPSLSSIELKGKVVSIDPSLDPTTRTLRVLAKVLPGQNSRLRPDSSTLASIEVIRGKGILIPEEALLKGARDHYVFVKENEKLIPTKIKIGRRFLDSFEVLSGLAPGQEILSYGTFLIDSESRLRGR